MTNTSAVIIMSNTLQALGLKRLVSDSFSIDAAVVQHPSDIIDCSDSVDFFFTDAEHFVAHLSFFLPRQSRTIVVSENSATTAEQAHIDPTAPQERIVEAIAAHIKRTASDANDGNTLSQRETEVLRLVASGCINKEIAHRLNISINTVLTHRKNITAKLGIKSVSGLTFYAMMNGLIAPQ